MSNEDINNTLLVQVVDEHQVFSTKLSNHMKQDWKLSDSGFDYHVLAVLGSQSTGKSTLLNRLFSTEFTVMNEKQRSQTTKGIWISKALDANVLVMDVEGTDGRERGEDQDFERKSALFSLAIAEVVLVNLWENMIGLYNGANMGLLKTVFAVNLELFQQSGAPKTCLCFVIRDFTGSTPVENLSCILRQDLEKIWDALVKPKGRENASLDDFFDVTFAALPHKIFANDKFNQETLILKNRFYESNSADYIFKPKYHKRIPADGFNEFAKSIWSSIITNRDLDLPSQQQLLAQYRCDEIERITYEKILNDIKPLRNILDTGAIISGFENTVSTFYNQHINEFDKEASRYHSEVYEMKRKQLLEKVDEILFSLFSKQMKNAHSKCLDTFIDLCKSNSSTGNIFMKTLNENRETVIQKFTNTLNDSILPNTEWNTHEFKSTFLGAIDDLSTTKKEEALNRMKLQLEKSVQESLNEPISIILDNGTQNMWQEIFEVYQSAFIEKSDVFQKRFNDFEFSLVETNIAVAEFKFTVWEKFLECIKANMQDIHIIERLRIRFESKFKYDDKGIPRIWKTGDDIDTVFEIARIESENLAKLLSVIKFEVSKLDSDVLENENFDEKKMILISSGKLNVLITRFKRDADSCFIEAKRSMSAISAKIPVWFIGLTIALGWNEILMVLRSPGFFFMIAIVLGISYMIWTMGLAGPTLQIVNATLNATWSEARKTLKDKGVDIDSVFDGSIFPQMLKGFEHAENQETEKKYFEKDTDLKKED